MSDFFTSGEIEKIGDAFAERGCHEPRMNPIEQGPPRRDAPFYHSGRVQISCGDVTKEYHIKQNNSDHISVILSDVRSGMFDRRQEQ